jgi:Sortase domain
MRGHPGTEPPGCPRRTDDHAEEPSTWYATDRPLSQRSPQQFSPSPTRCSGSDHQRHPALDLGGLAVTIRARQATEGRRKRRSRVLALLLVILSLAGVTTLALGVLGAGSTPTYVQAPVINKPFNPGDADTYTGPTDPPGATKGRTGTSVTDSKPLGPSELSVPSVGLRASIVDGGLTAKGAIDLPTSPLVAHYTPAAALGDDTGSTVIAGHVDEVDGSASPMALLAKIQKGAPIFVTDAKGTIHRYRATDARLYAKHALPESFFTSTGDPQLVLLTCGGPIGEIDGTINYLDNTAITAVPWP